VGDELRQMTKMALSMDLSTILHSLDAFQTALSRMKTMNKRTELEMTFIRLCSPELDMSPEALLRRIEALERGGLRLAPAAAAPVKEAEISVPETPETLQKPTQPAAQRGGSASIEALAKNAQPFDAWPEIIAMMKDYSTSVASAFRNSNAYVSGDYMLIDASEFAFGLLKQASQRDKIREMIQQVAGRPYKLGPYKAPPKEDKPHNTLDAFLQDMRDSGVEIEEK
jgi:DNA polymerase-3 subunit gamma/tau